ncbi:nucleotide exchange factor GrpE [bacterium]|nr:nucleotide exchange factor GrpE [bacterium]
MSKKDETSQEIENMDDIEIDESAENPFKVKNETEESEIIDENKIENISKEEYDKLNSQYIRLAADFDNYRKRQSQEREQLLKFGTEEALKKMIPVLDNFERAKKSLNDCEDLNKYKEAFELLQKQVNDELAKLGMEQIEAEGKEFDPNFHEAVMQTPTADSPEHTILVELQKGYKFKDKVLRPAMVNVAVAE